MFGLGFGEMVVLGVVLLVVVGPRELPKLLRSVGRGITKLRKMSADLRQQSGIDEIINEEGLREDLDAIRSLSRGRMVDGLVGAAMAPARKPPYRPRLNVKSIEQLTAPDGVAPERTAEYPENGPDDYGALADDASKEEIEAARAARAALEEARSETTPGIGVEGTTT